MKMLVLIEIDASKTMAETMQRSGFELAPDGTSLQVKIKNAPAIPQRKTKVLFVQNTKHNLADLMQFISPSSIEPAAVVDSK